MQGKKIHNSILKVTEKVRFGQEKRKKFLYSNNPKEPNRFKVLSSKLREITPKNEQVPHPKS